jgi:acyl-CoA thioesterase FadM
MAFFTLPYQIHFEDTMAYGSHHFMTNFKFQCALRETLLFNTRPDDSGAWKTEMDSVVMLTHQAYSRNLAPVELGRRVGLLMTYEEPSLSSVRLCFRAIRDDGVPVSCGFQSIVCLDARTQAVTAAPRVLSCNVETTGPASLLEPPAEETFYERVLKGGSRVPALFSDEVVAVGRHVANAPLRASYPRILDTNLTEFPLFGQGGAQ